MSRTPTLLVLIGLFVSALPALLPPTAAAASNDVLIKDAASDVVVVTTVEQAHAVTEPTPVPLADGFRPVDFTEVRVYGETPSEYRLGFTVADFTKPGTYPNQVDYVFCFRWDGTGSWYRLWVKTEYPVGGVASDPLLDKVLVTFTEIEDVSHCNIRTFAGSPNLGGMDFTVLQPQVDLEKNTFDIRIPRLEMEGMARQDEPRRPVPKQGQVFDSFVARATAKTGSEVYHAYDEVVSAGDRFEFTTNTGNSDLRVNIIENVHAASAGLRAAGGVPLYGVEIGGFQTVPLIIENRLGESLEVDLNPTILESSDAAAWTTRLLPRVKVGPATDEGPAVEHVTLIVTTASTIQHKDRARILVEATDPRFPGLLGAGLVDVLGVRPPTKEQGTLYFHTTGLTCNTADHWINTLKVDPAARSTDVALNSCDAAGGGSVEATTASLAFRPDVPFARDYELSVGDTAKGRIDLKAVRKVPGQPMEAATGMIADVTVAIYSGGTVIGETTVFKQQIGGTATPVAFEVPIEMPILGAHTRQVPNDRPLAVRIMVEKLQRTYVVCDRDLCGFEDERTVPDPTTLAGSIYLVTEGSEMTLPIVSSVRSGVIIEANPVTGALVSMRLADAAADTHRFTNPGKSVVFNVTVRNEGVNEDTATIGVEVNRTGWEAIVVPSSEFPLAVGAMQDFKVKVTAPAEVREGTLALVTIRATSGLDPEATATLPVRIEITRGVSIDDEGAGLKADATVEDSPMPAALPTTVLLLGLLVALRRRRA